MSKKSFRKRVCVSLTKPYLDALAKVIREEIYINKGEVVRDALRRLFKDLGIEIYRKRSH